MHKVMFRVQLCSALTKFSNFLPMLLHSFTGHVLNCFFHFRMLVAILFLFACASGAAIHMISLVSLLLYITTLYHHLCRYTLFISVSSTLAGTVYISRDNLLQFTDPCFIILASNSCFEHILCIMYIKSNEPN